MLLLIYCDFSEDFIWNSKGTRNYSYYDYYDSDTLLARLCGLELLPRRSWEVPRSEEVLGGGRYGR